MYYHEIIEKKGAIADTCKQLNSQLDLGLTPPPRSALKRLGKKKGRLYAIRKKTKKKKKQYIIKPSHDPRVTRAQLAL